MVIQLDWKAAWEKRMGRALVLTTSQQCALAATVVNGLQGSIRKSITSTLRAVILPLCSALYKSAPQYKRGTDVPGANPAM